MLRARIRKAFLRLKPTSVRKLMVWVAISGLICFGVATKMRWANFRRLAVSHKAEALSAHQDAESWKAADANMIRQLRILGELDIGGAVYGSGMVVFLDTVDPAKRELYTKLASDSTSDVEAFRQKLVEESSRRAVEEDHISRWYLSRWW